MFENVLSREKGLVWHFWQRKKVLEYSLALKVLTIKNTITVNVHYDSNFTEKLFRYYKQFKTCLHL